MSRRVIYINPRMDLEVISEVLCCDRDACAYVLLELLAEGHHAQRLAALKEDDLLHALNRACARMERMGL